MAVVRSLKNATLTLGDYQGGTEVWVATLEDGDININIPDQSQHVLDRGGPGTLIDAEHEDITWSMTAQLQSMTADPGWATVIGGTASGWTFSEADIGGSGDYSALQCSLQDVASAVKVFQASIVIVDPAGGSSETLYLLNNTCQTNLQEGMPDKLSLSLRCNGYSAADFWANIA